MTVAPNHLGGERLSVRKKLAGRLCLIEFRGSILFPGNTPVMRWADKFRHRTILARTGELRQGKNYFCRQATELPTNK